MKTGAIILVFLTILLSGCFYAYYPQTGSETYRPTQAENIEIYSESPKQEYVVLGSLAADVIGGADAAVDHLKKKAAALGADAVIKVQFSNNTTCGGTGVSGVAVKIQPNTVAQTQDQSSKMNSK